MASALRNLLLLEMYRDRDWERGMDAIGDDSHGCFRIPAGTMRIDQPEIRIMISGSDGWDHVSCSTRTRCCTWEEMEFVKRLFFREDATVMQLHVPPAEHKNCHPYCLHLWRPHHVAIPRPPSMMVAP